MYLDKIATQNIIFKLRENFFFNLDGDVQVFYSVHQVDKSYSIVGIQYVLMDLYVVSDKQTDIYFQ